MKNNVQGDWEQWGSHPQPLDFCCYLVTYEFQSESALYIFLNVKEVIAGNRHHIWSLSDSNEIRTHNHLVRKRSLSQTG